MAGSMVRNGVNRLGAWLSLSIGISLLVMAAPASAKVGSLEVSEYQRDFDVSEQRAEAILETQLAGIEADIAGQLQAQLGPDYAGLWFDNARGEYVVPLLPAVDRDATAGTLAAAGMKGGLRFSSAEASWLELRAAQRDLNAELLAPLRQGLIETSLAPRANAVLITQAEEAGAHTRRDVQRAANAAAVEVETRTSEVPRFDSAPEACTDPYCDTPLRGGVAIYSPSSPEASVCTAGFPALSPNGTRYLITAGHCIQQAYVGAPLYLEWATKTSALQQQTIGSVEQWERPNGDWAKIKVTGSPWSDGLWASQIVQWGATQSAENGAIIGKDPPIDLEHLITGEAASVEGGYACHTGVKSGTSCGPITGVNVTYTTAGTTYTNLNKIANACSMGGDSGGPYFLGGNALGLHHKSTKGGACGGELYYSDILKATNALGVKIGGAKPTVETGGAPEVRDTEALITGTVNPNALTTTFRFEYGMSTSYGKSIPVPDETAGSGNSPVVVSKTIQGLEARSHYHYRLVATNSLGTTYGADRTFTTGLKWLLRNSNSAGGAEDTAWIGLPGWIPVSGDWNGDGKETPGAFNPLNGMWRLSNSLSKSGKVDNEFQYGGPGSKPVVGNWDGVGADGIGVYYPDGAGVWHLRECVCGGNPDYGFEYGGGPWKNPVAGDWNNDGIDTIGVYDPQAGNWNLRNSNSSGGPDYSFKFGGGVWNTSLVGDWNGDGTDTIGVYDPQAGNWNMRDSNNGGGADHAFQFGGSQFEPIAGDWDGSGNVTVGLIANNGEVLTPPRPPVVTTQAPTAVSEGKATLKGTVNPNGFTTRYRFEWGATTSYGTSVPVSYASAGMGASPVAVSANISGLLGGTTYHYRLVAYSAEGKKLGADETFQTPPGDGTAESLAEMALTQPFNGGSASVADFNSNWGKLGWAAAKGEDLASGWRPASTYPTAQGAFSNLRFSDEKGAAAAATMAANPASAERYFSLWLGMGSASGASRSGYELRFTYVSVNTYTVTLSKWSSDTKTVLATKGSVTFANGNSLALVDKGSVVSGWVKTGSAYSELLSASDSTFSSGNAGVAGSGSSTRLTNFKVGSLLPNTTSEPGTSSTWNLRYSNTTGAPELSVLFGVAGQKEVVGDWNGDGISTFGTFDASTGTWKLRNSNGPGPAEIVFKFGGGSFSTPVVGDWNGDGIDTAGAFDPNNGNWTLRYSNLEGAADQAFQYGGSGSKPIAGNWDGVGADGIGVYYPSPGNWNLRECVCGGNPTYSFQYGGGVWKNPIAGNWDGVGADGIGVYDPQAGNWNLRHCMCGGNPDYAFQYGGGIWGTPVVGDWKGNGTDTIGVVND